MLLDKKDTMTTKNLYVRGSYQDTQNRHKDTLSYYIFWKCDLVQICWRGSNKEKCLIFNYEFYIVY
jgi:hypothetical protein